MHCPNVVELRVTSSDITDEVTGWVAKCPRLELVELHDNKLVTAVGYAQLLRASPKIRLFRSALSLLSFPLFDRCSILPLCAGIWDGATSCRKSSRHCTTLSQLIKGWLAF